MSEKEPSLIQPEDEFRALKDFGGLFKHLEVGKIDHNKIYSAVNEKQPVSQAE